MAGWVSRVLGLKVKNERIAIQTLGGDLEVQFHKNSEQYTDILLKGPAVEVFKGELIC